PLRPRRPRRRLAAEEPALQQRQHFLARERLRVALGAVALEHVDVVLEQLVRPLERIVELVALELPVVLLRLVGGAELWVDDAPDGPHRTRLALDPDDDPLLLAGVVDALECALREPPG